MRTKGLAQIYGAGCLLSLALVIAGPAQAGFIVFEAAGANPAAITPTRDAFRVAVGGGTVAGANGSSGGIRREINWNFRLQVPGFW